MMVWQLWWVWMVAAAVLAILEVVVPGFILAGFAVGAFVTGLLVAVSPTIPLAWLSLVWALVALGAFVALRKWLGLRRGQVKTFDSDING